MRYWCAFSASVRLQRLPIWACLPLCCLGYFYCVKYFCFGGMTSTVRANRVFLFFIGIRGYVSYRVVGSYHYVISSVRYLTYYIVMDDRINVNECSSCRFARCDFGTSVPFHLR